MALWNLSLYKALAWPYLKDLLKSCDLIHSVDASFPGILASAWARRAGVHHVTQVIGGDLNSVLPRIYRRHVVRGWDTPYPGVRNAVFAPLSIDIDDDDR